jgi:DNA transposition AAA+ family ATPase
MTSSRSKVDSSKVEKPEITDLEGEIRRLGKQLVLEVPKMLEFHKWLDRKRMARRSCRVIGESRTGKTVNCETYQLKRKIVQLPGQPPSIPVVYWHCPGKSNMSLGSFFIGMLQCLRYQITRGRNPELRERLYQVLRGCQVEMIILDEAHRIPDKILSEIQDLSDYLEIAVVLVGTHRLNTLLEQDDQVDLRFCHTYHFSPLNADEFREMTALWEEHVLQLPKSSNLTTVKAQNMLYPATRGYIGLLDEILCEAASRVIEEGKSHVDLNILKDVIAECKTDRL